MPATWAPTASTPTATARRDPSDPDDAIYAAANYLRASGARGPVRRDLRLQPRRLVRRGGPRPRRVLRRPRSGALGAPSLIPTRLELVCAPSHRPARIDSRRYLHAFEHAAARYELGNDVVWALAAVARLESDFGRGMGPKQLRVCGPSGSLDANWERFAVDGDDDGKIAAPIPADSAATLARLIWSPGSLRAGIFAHNQAPGTSRRCSRRRSRSRASARCGRSPTRSRCPGRPPIPINWENLELSTRSSSFDLQQGGIDQRVLILIAAISQEHTLRISSLRSDHG